MGIYEISGPISYHHMAILAKQLQQKFWPDLIIAIHGGVKL